jgi:hypothetical protein
VSAWKEGVVTVYSVLRNEPSVRFTRALECLRSRLAGYQGHARTAQRATEPETMPPELEWALLRAVRRAARQYRRAQQALAGLESTGGSEATFKARLDEVRLTHDQLDATLLVIQRYYEATGRPDE